MNTILHAQIFGMTWWALLLWIVYFLYTFRAIWVLIYESHLHIREGNQYKDVISFRAGFMETFFDPDEEYFRLWDLVRVAFSLPAIILALLLLLLKHGIWQFFPFLRSVFGFKLFKLKKTTKD